MIAIPPPNSDFRLLKGALRDAASERCALGTLRKSSADRAGFSQKHQLESCGLESRANCLLGANAS